jgi:hypothetical protein
MRLKSESPIVHPMMTIGRRARVKTERSSQEKRMVLFHEG